jgi:hypothetical protein
MAGPKLVQCEEDTDFLNEFQKLVVDDYQSRRTENLKVPSFDVAVPMQLGKKKPGSEEGSRVNFMVMLKKGNRQQLRDLHVPITSDLAANIREKQQEEQAEQEEVKRLVLDYNQRQEEEQTYNGGNYAARFKLFASFFALTIIHVFFQSCWRSPVSRRLATVTMVAVRTNLNQRGFLKPSKHSS